MEGIKGYIITKRVWRLMRLESGKSLMRPEFIEPANKENPIEARFLSFVQQLNYPAKEVEQRVGLGRGRLIFNIM